MKLACFALVACLAVLASAAPNDLNVEANEVEQTGSWERIARMMKTCVSSDDLATCLAVKGVTAINRAARMQDVELFSGVRFERDNSVSIRDGKSLDSENEIENTLPAEPTKRAARLIDMFMEAAGNFLSTHNLQVKLAPEEIASAARTFNEARGKIKKLLGPILLGVGLKVLAIVAIFGGGLALLVTKALIVAKLAFVAASVLGLQKLLGGGGGSSGGSIIGTPSKNTGWANTGANQGQWSTGGTTGWSNSGGSSGYPYARSIQTEAQEMAYGAQKP